MESIMRGQAAVQKIEYFCALKFPSKAGLVEITGGLDMRRLIFHLMMI